MWSVAADAAGNAYVGMGGTAAGGAVVMRVAPDGKATKVFEGKELGVQALRLGADGQMYAATSPDGKVYRLGAAPADAVVVFDPAQTAEKPKYLWDVVQAAGSGRARVGIFTWRRARRRWCIACLRAEASRRWRSRRRTSTSAAC